MVNLYRTATKRCNITLIRTHTLIMYRARTESKQNNRLSTHPIQESHWTRVDLDVALKIEIELLKGASAGRVPNNAWSSAGSAYGGSRVEG